MQMQPLLQAQGRRAIVIIAGSASQFDITCGGKKRQRGMVVDTYFAAQAVTTLPKCFSLGAAQQCGAHALPAHGWIHRDGVDPRHAAAAPEQQGQRSRHCAAPIRDQGAGVRLTQ